MKVLINDCYGGYGISTLALSMYGERLSSSLGSFVVEDEYTPRLLLADGSRISCFDIPRNNPVLIKIFEEIGSEDFSGMCADVKLVEVPDGFKYSIDEYDGLEYINQIWIEANVNELATGLSQEKLDLINSCIASGFLCDVKVIS